MEGYSTFLFDWDGCLARTLELWIDVCDQALARQGITAPRAEIRKYYRSGGVAKTYGVEATAWGNDIEEIAMHHIKNIQLYEGAKEALEVLAKTKRLAIITDSPRKLVMQNLSQLGLKEYFQIIIAQEDVMHRKPHPEGIKHALTYLAVEPYETVMIGDSAKDIQAAKNAGIDSILIYPHLHHMFYDVNELLQHQPTHVINSFMTLQQQCAP